MLVSLACNSTSTELLIHKQSCPNLLKHFLHASGCLLINGKPKDVTLIFCLDTRRLIISNRCGWHLWHWGCTCTCLKTWRMFPREKPLSGSFWGHFSWPLKSHSWVIDGAMSVSRICGSTAFHNPCGSVSQPLWLQLVLNHKDGSQSSREIKIQNASCQMGGRKVTRRQNCFFLQENERSRCYSVINQHPGLPSEILNCSTLSHVER